MKKLVKIPVVRKTITIPVNAGAGSAGQPGTFVTFRGLSDSGEHLAIGFGDWKNQKNPLVRIHSECLTGDVFGSGKCDCGDQLKEAMTLMQKTGGILLYLRQEGRGIGLYNKLDAYVLQAMGYDTYEANRILGFNDDQRNYLVAAEMLQALGKKKIRLLSNNPDKAAQLEAHGIEVNLKVETGVFVNETNRNYLKTKVLKTGHKINLNGTRSCPKIEQKPPVPPQFGEADCILQYALLDKVNPF
jgi:GTP cyclohydrolase II